MQFRQILKKLSKTQKGKIKLRETFDKYKYRLTDGEYKLLIQYFLEKLTPSKIAYELGFSKSHYYTILCSTLSKFEALINDATLRDLIENA